MRVGATSCAAMEPETSTVSTTVACFLATSVAIVGRATATMSAVSASSASAAGTCRRQPGVLSTTLASRSRFGEAHGVLRAAPLHEEVAEQAERHQQQPEQGEGPGEAHRRTPAASAGGGRWPGRAASRREVRQHDVPRAGARRSVGDLRTLGGGRLGEALRAACGCGCRRAAGGRSRDRQARGAPTSGSSCSRGSRISTAITSWRAASWSSEPAPVARAAEVAHDDDQRATARRGAPTRRSASAERRRAAALVRRLLAQRVRAGRAGRRGPVAAAASRGRGSPNVTTPSRLPRRVATWPSTRATPSATSALRRSAVPKVIEAEASSTSQVVSARSATSTRTCGSPVRAVTFQSMRRTSSPGSYGRICASSRAGAAARGAVVAGEQAVDPPRRSDRSSARSSAVRAWAPGRAGPACARAVGRVGTVMRPRPGRGRGAAAARRRARARRSVGGDALGQRLVGEDEAVAQHVGGEVARRPAAARSGGRAGAPGARPACTRLIGPRGLAPNAMWRVEVAQAGARRLARGDGQRDGVALHARDRRRPRA